MDRIKEIRDQLEAQGCPVQKSLKVAQLIHKAEQKSSAARIASSLLIGNWRNIVGSEGL
ncbi:MAG: hypothetical protein WCA35_01650 [Kovacikia sp.]